MIDDTTLEPIEGTPEPAATPEPEPPVVDPEAGAGGAPSEHVEDAPEVVAAPVDGAGWSDFQKALEAGGLTIGADAVGTSVPLADAVKALTPKVIASLPPEVRVGLRTAMAFVAKAGEDAAKIKTDGLAEIEKREKLLSQRERQFTARREAFYKVANKTANLDSLRKAGEGADKADTLTEEGRRKVFAAELHKTLFDEFAPLRQESAAAAFEADRQRGADATEALLAKFPQAREPAVRTQIEAQIDAWDAPWLAKAKAQNLDPDSMEAYAKLGPPPSAGRLQDAIEITLGRIAAAQRDQQRLRETAARAAAANNISTSTTAGSGGAPATMPEMWKGEKLRGNLVAQMQWRQDNPRAAARFDEERRARHGG